MLARRGSSPMSRVATYTGIDRTTLTRLADRLVEAGLTERVPEPKDRRQVLLALTPRGAEVHRQALALSFEVNRRFGAALSEKRLRLMSRDLEKILRRMSPDEALIKDILNLWTPQGVDTA